MGLTLGQLRDTISSSELTLWRAYESQNGLPLDRLEWTIANGASAICHSLGSRTSASDIIPKIQNLSMSQDVAIDLFNVFVDTHNKKVK